MEIFSWEKVEAFCNVRVKDGLRQSNRIQGQNVLPLFYVQELVVYQYDLLYWTRLQVTLFPLGKGKLNATLAIQQIKNLHTLNLKKYIDSNPASQLFGLQRFFSTEFSN